VFLSYARYARVLKWLTLSLLAYVAALAMVEVRWGEALLRLVVPAVAWDAGYLTAVVAVLGTTISPYLFFWQASQEAEDVGADPRREPLRRAPAQGPAALARIRLDTLAGMAFSNLVALAIILTTAATLHAHGVTAVETSAQAAEALRPIAGPYAAAVFAAGVIGTGLLAVPVLAGSAAYAVGEARRWPVGLARRPAEAKAFYGTLAAATAVGAALNLTPIDPIEALYWAAVVNGVVAVPVLAATMALAARSAVMGAGLEVRGALRALGWAAAGAMALAVAAMAAAAAL
jgi:Mn2+/Fe2+ NRAMP family transporter